MTERTEPPQRGDEDPRESDRRGWFGEPGGFGSSTARGEYRDPGGFREARRFTAPGEPAGDEEGSAVPGPDAERGRAAGGGGPRSVPDLSVLLTILDTVRAAVPRELQQQFTALLREVLLTVRVLIDRYLERLDGRSREARVEDIPID
jgi:hypothetical protein